MYREKGSGKLRKGKWKDVLEISSEFANSPKYHTEIV